MKKLRIIEHFDDYDPVVLGHVLAPANLLVPTIDYLWDEFSAMRDDCDSNFIDWLEKHHGFTKLSDEFEDVVVWG